MSRKRRTADLALILCLTLINGLVFSCGSESPPVETDISNEDISNSLTEEVISKSGVPDDYDLGGEIITIYNAPYDDGVAWLASVEEETGDTVEDAIYQRNLEVAEKLNIQLEFVHGRLADQPNHLRSTIMAGDDVYDFVLGTMYKYIPMTTEGLFLNLYNAPYIDIDSPWWATDYIESINFGKETIYYLVGDIHLSYLRFFGCIFYNKNLMDVFHGDPDLPYQLVLDGNWTIDKFIELSRDVYSDLNGNNVADDADRYGYAVMPTIISEHFYYDMGAWSMITDENYLPVLDAANERSVEIAEKLYSLFYESPGSWVLPISLDSIQVDMTSKLAADELLFAPGLLYLSDYLRDMKNDYGILPYPKYDEVQENYHTLVHDSYSMVFIPATSELEAAAAVIEEMAYQSYIYTTPAYFNVALKGKYMRDGDGPAIQIIDMIRENAYCDLGYVYNYAINEAGLLIRNLMMNKQSNLSSVYAAKESSAKAKLEDLIEAYNAIQ